MFGALQGPSRPKGSGPQTRPPAPTIGGAVPSHLSSARPRRAAPPVVGAVPGGALPPWAVCPPARARLTLPLALPLHHDVPVQRPGHGVGKLGALQERRHGAVGGARAVGARLCHELPDLGPGLPGRASLRRVAPGGPRRKLAAAAPGGGVSRAQRPLPSLPRPTPGVPRAPAGRGSPASALPAPRPAGPSLPAFAALSPRLLRASAARHFRPPGRLLPEQGPLAASRLGRREGRKRPRRVPGAAKPRRCVRRPQLGGPGARRGAARERGRGARSGTAFIGSLEPRVRNNCTEAHLPRARPPLSARRPGKRRRLRGGARGPGGRLLGIHSNRNENGNKLSDTGEGVQGVVFPKSVHGGRCRPRARGGGVRPARGDALPFQRAAAGLQRAGSGRVRRGRVRSWAGGTRSPRAGAPLCLSSRGRPSLHPHQQGIQERGALLLGHPLEFGGAEVRVGRFSEGS